MMNIMIFMSALLLLPTGASDDQKTEVRFPAGTRVEIDGKFDGEVLEAVKLVQEEDDDFLEIKGFLSAVNIEQSQLSVGPFTILINDKTDFDDSENDEESHEIEELSITNQSVQ